MSEADAARPARPVPRPREALIAALHALDRQVDDIRESLHDTNTPPEDDRIEHALDTTGKLLAAHLPEPHPRVVQALESLYRATKNLQPPVEDAEAEEPDYRLRTLRGGLGRLRMALDDTLEAARHAYPRTASIPEHWAHVTRAQVETFLTELEAFQTLVNAVAREENTAPAFPPQGELVTFYVRDMVFEIDLARVEAA